MRGMCATAAQTDSAHLHAGMGAAVYAGTQPTNQIESTDHGLATGQRHYDGEHVPVFHRGT